MPKHLCILGVSQSKFKIIEHLLCVCVLLILCFFLRRSLPSNWRDLHKLAKIGQSAIKAKTGITYRSGSVSVLIRRTAAGGSPDYALGIVKIPLVMTMELSGAGYGFHPPETEIKTLVHESWIGIKAMCMHVADS